MPFKKNCGTFAVDFLSVYDCVKGWGTQRGIQLFPCKYLILYHLKYNWPNFFCCAKIYLFFKVSSFFAPLIYFPNIILYLPNYCLIKVITVLWMSLFFIYTFIYLFQGDFYGSMSQSLQSEEGRELTCSALSYS